MSGKPDIAKMLAKMMGGPSGSGRGNMGPPSESAWLDIDPSDSTVPDFYLQNPYTFQPPSYEAGIEPWWHPWGRQNDDYDLARDSQRRMMTQFTYENKDTPEVQWVKVLAGRKLRKIREEPPLQSDVIFDIELAEVEPRVWRRVRVSAKTPLAALQDKVRSSCLSRTAA